MAEEKKEGFFSKFKKSINDSARESSIEAEFQRENETCTVYTGSGLFDSKEVYGKMDENAMTMTIYGKFDFPYSSILLRGAKAYYIISCKHDETDTVEVTIKEDEKSNTYTRQATILSLDPEVKEVKVIKVKDTFYLKKD